MKKLLAVLFMLSLTVAVVTCSDDGVEPEDTEFSLSLTVVNESETPLSDMNISVWCKLDPEVSSKINNVNEIKAVSNLRFSVAEESYVKLVSYELNGEEIETIMSDKLAPGVYTYHADFTSYPVNHLSNIKMTASTDAAGDNVLYENEIYALMYLVEAESAAVGKTDSKGNIKITNKLLFPFLYDIPEIPRTNEATPDIIGTIDFTNNVIIMVSNESFTKSIQYSRSIEDGPNEYTFEWVDDAAKQPAGKAAGGVSEKTYGLTKITGDQAVSSPIKWMFAQNYPNPYN